MFRLELYKDSSQYRVLIYAGPQEGTINEIDAVLNNAGWVKVDNNTYFKYSFSLKIIPSTVSTLDVVVDTVR